MKKFLRFVAILLCVTIFTQIVPVYAVENPKKHIRAYAEGDNMAMNQTDIPDDTEIELPGMIAYEYAEDDSNFPEAEIEYEDVSKREQLRKTFRMTDGTNTVITYAESVHYLDEYGKWQAVDNTLNESNGKIKAKNPAFAFEFNNAINGEYLYRIGENGSEISVRPVFENINKSTAEFIKIGEKDDKFIPDNLYSAIRYENVLENVSLEYLISPSKIKENIVINGRNEIYSYKYELDFSDNLTAEVKENRLLISRGDETIYEISAPVMTDARGAFSSDIKLILEEKNGKNYITVEAGKAWINDDARVFPVNIDPTVKVSGASGIEDLTVTSLNGNMTGTYLYFGLCYMPGMTYGYMYDYIKPDISVIPADSRMTGAILSYYSPSSAAGLTAELHEVTSSWTSSTVSWSNRPSINDDIVDYGNFHTQSRINFDITKTVWKWMNGNLDNNGIMIKAAEITEQTLPQTPPNDGSCYSMAFIYSADHTTYEACIPYLAITYVSQTGIEDKWSMHNVDFGIAGTAYVNDLTGQLTYVHSDAWTNGLRMPVSVSHIYNSNFAGTYFGDGWSLSCISYVSGNVIINGNSYCIYTDGDGTKHYFKYDTADQVYYLETDPSIKIYYASSPYTYVMESPDGGLAYFNGSGYLTRITDTNGNSNTIEYSSVGRPSYIIDGNGNAIVFTYSNGKLTKIRSGRNNSQGVLQTFYELDFEYTTNGNLRCIYYPDDTYTEFGYSDSLLSSVTFESANPTRMMEIWPNAQCVDYIKIYGGESETVPATYFERFQGQTEITDRIEYASGSYDKYSVTETFDGLGRLVNAEDSTGQNRTLEYSSEGDLAKLDQIVFLSESFKQTNNLLTYGGAEESDSTNRWRFHNLTSFSRTSNSVDVYTGQYAYKIKPFNVNNAYIEKDITVSSGSTYTLSAYMKSVGTGKVFIGFEYDDAHAVHQFRTMEYDVDNEYTRVSYSYTFDNIVTNTTVSVCIGIQGSTADLFIDGITLEKEAGAGRFNHVENGDFSSNVGWNIAEAGTGSSYNSTNEYYKITGKYNERRSISKTVFLQLESGKHITVSGKAKANAAAYGTTQGRIFAIQADIYAGVSDTVPFQTELIKFNPNVTEWQNASKGITLNGNCSKIILSFVYANNINFAWFDDLQLYTDVYGTEYSYDTDNRLISVRTNEGKTEYVYDTVWKYNVAEETSTDKFGREITTNYYYDGNGNLKRKDVPSSFSNTDSEGNVLIPNLREYKLITRYYYGTENTGGNPSSYGNVTYTNTYGKVYTPTTSYETAQPLSYTSYTYLPNYSNAISETSARGTVYQYGYDFFGRLISETDEKGNVTTYSYDEMSNVISTSVGSGSSTPSVQTEYTGSNLTKITRNGMTYNFSYNELSAISAISICNMTIASYEYDDNTGYLDRLMYGNGQYKNYGYDSYGRTTSVLYSTGERFYYEYNLDGQIIGYNAPYSTGAIFADYYYDYLGRLSEIRYGDGAYIKYEYPEKLGHPYNNPDYDSYGEEYGAGSSWTYTEYVYDKYGTLRESYVDSALAGNYYYDALGRPITVKYDEIDTGYSYLDEYTYVADTALVSSHTKTIKNSSGNTISVKTVGYEYDNNGNITKITDGSSQVTYQYDNLNQLIRENNSATGKTVTYTYDNRGNILDKKEYAYTTSSSLGTPLHTYVYAYSTGDWKDQLVSYDGSGITYDNVGNPTSYMGKTMTWTMGRNLGKVTVGSKEYFYKYDGEGLRVSKEYTSGGSNITIKYLYDGVRLLEEYGSRNIQFLYDGGNTPIGFQYGGNTYYYNKNIFGDVIGIFDTNLNTVVTYAYDSWGKLLSIKSANGVDVTNNTSGIGYINPIRYRGYYYDNETGLYYLQSRYYDPEVGRFVNADGQLTTGSDLTGLNLFAYCGNNPVNRVDPTGEAWWHWALGITAAVAAVALTAVTLGTAAPAAACSLTMIGMSIGMSYAAASTVATVAVVATTAVASAYAGDIAFSTITGQSLLLDTVFQGNQTAYETGYIVSSIATAGMLNLAANSPGTCFIAGTLIAEENGNIPIETISVGDYVFAYNTDTGMTQLKEVVNTFVRESNELVHIEVNGEKITTTPTHPFWVPQKGWTQAVNLRAGDRLQLLNGEYVVIEQIQHEILEAPVTVYNFEVEGFHTYFITDSQILVHNANYDKMGKSIGNMTGDHDKQKKQVRDALNAIGQNTPKNKRILHEAIHGMGYGYQEILDEAIQLFGDGKKR